MPTSNPFDPDALRVPDAEISATQKRAHRKAPRHRPGEEFIKGPVPWRWVKVASSLSGKVFPVALVLWKQVGCQKSLTVRFCLSHAAELGVKPDAARRALRSMADAGLVKVEHHPGQCPLVTLLNWVTE
jgi:hypothetical protein